mmetsp:Transcript_32702/g.37078  ORF Transcript_32702/g.37078 Transcript_32702/m.37078 type:complete len:82 (-) Transcript_32702:278-523(-)
MKEQEHKREVERLWQIKLDIYRQQREEEQAEKRRQEEEEQRKREIVELEKEKLLREHAELLQDYLPKGTLTSSKDRKFVGR